MASSARSEMALRMPSMNRRCHSWGIWPLPPVSAALLVRTEMPMTSNVATSDLVGWGALGAGLGAFCASLGALWTGLGAFCAESEVTKTRKSTDATSEAEVKRNLSFIVMGECTTCLGRSDKCALL